MNLAMWTGYALWTPVIFWLGRNFRFGRRGWTRLLTEGGPSWLSTLVAHGLLDELCLSMYPTLVGGDHPRPLSGPV